MCNFEAYSFSACVIFVTFNNQMSYILSYHFTCVIITTIVLGFPIFPMLRFLVKVMSSRYRGQVPAKAEYRYLNKVKWLDMYGVDLHPVQVS